MGTTELAPVGALTRSVSVDGLKAVVHCTPSGLKRSSRRGIRKGTRFRSRKGPRAGRPRSAIIQQAHLIIKSIEQSSWGEFVRISKLRLLNYAREASHFFVQPAIVLETEILFKHCR